MTAKVSTPQGSVSQRAPSATLHDKADFFHRLARVIDSQLKVLEARLNEDTDAPDQAVNAAARERDARTLTSLVRLLEKLNDIEASQQQSSQDTTNLYADDDEAALRFREELAQRIQNFLREEPSE